MQSAIKYEEREVSDYSEAELEATMEKLSRVSYEFPRDREQYYADNALRKSARYEIMKRKKSNSVSHYQAICRSCENQILQCPCGT